MKKITNYNVQSTKKKFLYNFRFLICNSARFARGQVMLLTTLVLSGTILAAVTIAGLLLVYQIRQAGTAAQSARAIYAADAGFEWQAYRLFRAIELDEPEEICNVVLSPFLAPAPTISSRINVLPDSGDGEANARITSSALSNNATRVVQFNFSDMGERAVCAPTPS